MEAVPIPVLQDGLLSPDGWRKFKLIEKVQENHNVIKFRFELPTPSSSLGLPIGQHVSLLGVDAEGKEFSRAYTPTTLDSDKGIFDLVIKIYPDGAMSQYVAKFNVGDEASFKGPKGKFRYKVNEVRAFGMIAGGTGITPMFQVARAILENPNDWTQIKLIFANVTEDDILLKKELDEMQRKHPQQFSVYYVLNKPPENWSGGVGHVSKDMIVEHLPPPADDIKILRCGPPPMNKAMAAHLEELGYSTTMMFKF